MGPLIWTALIVLAALGCLLFARRLRKALAQGRETLTTLKAKRDSAGQHEKAALDNKIDKAKGELTAGIWIRRLAVGLAFVFLGIIVAMSIVVVPTRNVAVSSALGRPTDTLANGPHLIWPWESTTTYDATVQTLEMADDGKDDKPRQNVRIMGGVASAGMNVLVEWRIDPDVDIQALHKDWRDFDAVDKRVVRPRLSAALNTVFEKFDPLAAQRSAGTQAVSMGAMEPLVRDELQATVPPGIQIRKVMITYVEYPAQVQKALNDMQVELANTQVALQQKVTAEAQKAAIETLASAKMTPEAFQQYCLIVTERLAQQGKPISAAWNCSGASVPITVAGK